MPVIRHPAAQSLSSDELQAMCASILAMPGGGTLANIQAAVKAATGLDLKPQSASNFKRGVLTDYAERVAAYSRTAQLLNAHKHDLQPGQLADAAAVEATQQTFDLLLNLDSATAEDGLQQLDMISKIVARLRSGDHSMLKLQADLKAAEAKAKAAEDAIAATKADLTNESETLEIRAARMRERFGV
jgi:hypothetical protein